MKQDIKKIFIKTLGCQMNAYDSQVAVGLLEQAGFQVILDRDQENKSETGNFFSKNGCSQSVSAGADVVIMNTCSVRDHAEQRVWGRLGMLGIEKRERPGMILGLMGCMVEEHREGLFKRFPQLDFVIGTRNIKELPRVIREVIATRQKVARIKQEGISIEYSEFTKRDNPYHAWLPVMTGCNKMCTFCIVPKTRGSEVSIPAEEVLWEARRLVADGVKWITLLGQNVNSYIGNPKQILNPSGSKFELLNSDIVSDLETQDPDLSAASNIMFPQLLEMLCRIDGLERISFTTSHPSDATEELFQVIARNPKISRRFHLPLQSGSDRMLRRMKRLHTYADYKKKIERLRELVPGISITTDIIVGFSGESDEDYRATRQALEAIRFDGAFIYKYSVRPGTPAARLPDDVLQEVKSARNNELLALQRGITSEKNRAMIGQTLVVFVEGGRWEREGEYSGRTDQDRRVLFDSDKNFSGTFVRLRLESLFHETYRGVLV